MSETQSLLLIIFILYLSECVIWIPRNSVAFVLNWGKRWTVALPSVNFGNLQGGLYLINPFPPLGNIFRCQTLPVSISSRKICSYTSQAWTKAGRPQQSSQCFDLSNIEEVSTQSNKVYINGALFVKCVTSKIAKNVVELIKRLSRSSYSSRAHIFESTISHFMDVGEIDLLLKEYQKRTIILRLLCIMAWFYLFVLAPILMWHYGFIRLFLPAIIVLLVFNTIIIICFYRTHKSLLPIDKDDRLNTILKIVFCPPFAIRANDSISLNYFDRYNPIAVGKVLLTETDFNRFVQWAVLDLKHPLMDYSIAKEVKITDIWYRKRVLKNVEAFLYKYGIDVYNLTKPDMLSDDSCVSYCPRCLCNYTILPGTCKDCTGVKLVALLKESNNKCVGQ